LPPTLANVLAQDDEGEIDTGSYGDGQSSYDKNSFKFVCINNNNNTEDGEEEPIVPTIPPEPPGPPQPTTASLTVTKTTTCDLPNRPDLCEEFDPLLTVTGTDPVPSSFPASDTPVVVTLGAGSFSVEE
jgi:hypothetical protein